MANGIKIKRSRFARIATTTTAGLLVLAISFGCWLSFTSSSGDVAKAAPGAAFDLSTDQAFMIYGNPQTQLSKIVLSDTIFDYSPIGTPWSGLYNALGFNTSNGYLYAIAPASQHLIQIDSTGMAADLGSVGLPTPAINYNNGTFGVGSSANTMYVYDGVSPVMYSIDVGVTTPVAVAIDLSKPMVGVIDFAYSNGYLWGVSGLGAGTQPTEDQIGVYRVNPVNGQVDLYPADTLTNMSGFNWAGGYGAVWFYGNGNLGALEGSHLYQIKINNPTSSTPIFTLVSVWDAAVPTNGNADGASNPVAAPIDLSITKTGSGTYTAGQEVSYTLKVTNHSATKSSGFLVTDVLGDKFSEVTTDVSTCKVTDKTLQCVMGELAAGASVEIEVKAVVKADFTGVLTNTANVLGNEEDKNSDNNSSSWTTKQMEIPVEVVPGVPNTGVGLRLTPRGL